MNALYVKGGGLMLKWPDYFPEKCPPSDAESANGRFLRLVRNSPPQPTDFAPWRIENPNGNVSDECKACGVSVLRDIADVQRLRKRVPGHRKKLIAVGTLTPELGLIKHTPSRSAKSHHSWWVPKNADPCPHFKILVEEGESCSAT